MTSFDRFRADYADIPFVWREMILSAVMLGNITMTGARAQADLIQHHFTHQERWVENTDGAGI